MPLSGLARAVPDTFPNALVRHGRPHLDVAAARRQHAGYVEALRRAGYAIEVLPADESHPDCPFIEDVAVVLDTAAVAARPGAPSRRGETIPVATALAAVMPIVAIEAPGTLDGGDVLRIDDVLYVGRSRRTNDQGIAQLAAHAAADDLTVVPVDVTGVLHLKSAIWALDPTTVLVMPGMVDERPFAPFRMIPVDESERGACSVLPLADGSVLATDSAPSTIARLVATGYEVAPIDVSEFLAADGGLTCLSILW